ncbi:MAG: sulfotransferase [Deltaproteobacteria bacterium]|nr:sulfotransferase [Deltaproteobacteria bacterium]
MSAVVVPANRETSRRYARPYRPWVLRAANRTLGVLQGAGLGSPDLTVAGLLAEARRRAGLWSFGDDTLSDRLRLLVEAVVSEARLHPLGRWMFRENAVRTLVNRLRMEDDWARHPEIADVPLPRPVFVVGLQRTGTTVLHRMLASDPARRFLPSWEAVNIAPVPRRANGNGGNGGGNGNGKPDPRLGPARFAERALRYMAPDFFAIHPVEAEAPEEDVLLFEYAVWSTVPEAMMHVPSFSAWLARQDHREAYRFYARVLRYLQWQRPGGPWVLKTPHHMEHLDVLFEVFPDARVLQTHRDPTRVLASFCSMMSHSRGVFSDRVDPCAVGRHWFAKARRMIERSTAVRDAHRDGRFLDVHYGRLVADPLAELRRVYEFLGDPLTPTAEEAMRAWLRDNPQHKHGRHRYRLEDFGLDRDEVARLFADYRARFGIPDEA